MCIRDRRCTGPVFTVEPVRAVLAAPAAAHRYLSGRGHLGCHAAALRHPAGPVSYTHLDVYKRQAYDSIPSLGEVFNVNTFSILLIYIPVGFSEALSYTPILGLSLIHISSGVRARPG